MLKNFKLSYKHEGRFADWIFIVPSWFPTLLTGIWRFKFLTLRVKDYVLWNYSVMQKLFDAGGWLRMTLSAFNDDAIWS